MVTRGEGVTNGDGVALWVDENVLELDRGDGCTALNVLNVTEWYILIGLKFYIYVCCTTI